MGFRVHGLKFGVGLYGFGEVEGRGVCKGVCVWGLGFRAFGGIEDGLLSADLAYSRTFGRE